MGRRISWSRYVDDVIVITSKGTNLQSKRRRFNEVNEKIQFTNEEETESGILPFLDTKIYRTDARPRFSVHRKPTNKDDFIHFLSAHSERTKRGVVIGCFLRALRICSTEYLKEEKKTPFEHSEN